MGSIKFNAEEVLGMAAQIEVNGAAFYRKAAEFNEEGRELLTAMAEQEDEHIAMFKEMKANLPASDSEETAFDPNNEAGLNLKAMADANVFNLDGTDPDSKLDGSESLDDIIKEGLRAEKESIVFYTVLKDIVPASLGKDKIEAIIKEELKHITWLINRKVV